MLRTTESRAIGLDWGTRTRKPKARVKAQNGLSGLSPCKGISLCHLRTAPRNLRWSTTVKKFRPFDLYPAVSIFHPAAVKKNLRSRSIQQPRRSTDLSDGARPPVDGEAKALPPPADGGFTADVDGQLRRSSAPTIIGTCARHYPTSGALAACPSTAPKAGRERR